jgi:hypothetical protein
MRSSHVYINLLTNKGDVAVATIQVRGIGVVMHGL